ncbi:MAG: hypothetical protein HY429_01065 [Candidatus Levybacteria bacterium]|nr:hypothetical protein [Candidatus Levybacteria bacterium]
MITIFHGNNIESSRNAYTKEKGKHSNAIVFDGKVVTLTDLIQAIDSGGLFSEEKVVVIEELFARKSSSELNALISFIVKTSSHMLFWEGKELTKKQLSSLPEAKIETHSYPKVLFQFLDSIAPKNRNSLMLFHELLRSTPTELIFFMLVRHFRMLLAFSDKITANIDEVAKLATWQKTKLQRQASRFSKHQLTSLYKNLYYIDDATKTGKSPLSLTASIDFFLVGL